MKARKELLLAAIVAGAMLAQPALAACPAGYTAEVGLGGIEVCVPSINGVVGAVGVTAGQTAQAVTSGVGGTVGGATNALGGVVGGLGKTLADTISQLTSGFNSP